MPGSRDLPDDLIRLSRRNAFELSDRRWKHDVDNLIVALDKILTQQREARHRAEEEAEREQREAEARREADESERLKPAAAEAERRNLEAEGAERGKPEAEERERRRGGERAPVTVEKRPSVTSAEAIPARAARLAPLAMQPKRTVLAWLIALIILAFGAAGITWAVRRALTTREKTPPTAAKAQGDKTGEGTGAGGEGTGAGGTGSTRQRGDSPQAPPGMVYVPGGEFRMGNDEGGAYEKPAHMVAVKSFFIDQYEVTNEEYAKFVKATKREPPQTWQGGTYGDGTARHPVTGVTWADADAYAIWADERLPTEEEWEFAARGGDKEFRYPWGNEWKDGLANANSPSGGLAEVGSYKGASPFGVFDMVGNAWEWTASKLTAYKKGQPLPDVPQGTLRVIRGGSYIEDKSEATTTYRRGYPVSGVSYVRTGFRCVKDVTDSLGHS
jgi:formylglycine-generating enzyme required for sulfatase activity